MSGGGENYAQAVATGKKKNPLLYVGDTAAHCQSNPHQRPTLHVGSGAFTQEVSAHPDVTHSKVRILSLCGSPPCLSSGWLCHQVVPHHRSAHAAPTLVTFLGAPVPPPLH